MNLTFAWLLHCTSQKLQSLLAGPILDNVGMGAFFWGTFSEKRAFCLLAIPKQMSFFTISNENIFSKTEGTRLDGMVTPNKDLEQALVGLYYMTSAWFNSKVINF